MNPKKLMSSPENFTTHNPISPAQKAQQKWDEREGQIIEQNRNLRKLLVLAFVAILLLSGACAYISLSSKLIPYIVEVDKDEGVVRNVGTIATSNAYKPNVQTYQWVIRTFLEDTRGITLDPIVFNQKHVNAFGYVTKDAASKLQTMFATDKIMERFGKETVQINITNILPMEGGNSYQVRWTEESYVVDGGARTVTPYTGIFTIQDIKTDDEAQLSVNPLGIYISDFSWSRDAGGNTNTANTSASSRSQVNR